MPAAAYAYIVSPEQSKASGPVPRVLVRVADLGERGPDGLARRRRGAAGVARRGEGRPATAVVTRACSVAESRAKSAW